jgi:hypothetical protein
MSQIGRTVANAKRPCPCHVCAFFSSKEEAYQVMLPLIADGLWTGDKLVHIINKNHRGERLSRLNEIGIDVETAASSGQLELLPWEQAHVIDGWLISTACLRALRSSWPPPPPTA